MVGPFIVEGAKTYPLIDLSYFKIPFVLVVCINWLRHGINKNKINRTSYKYSTIFFEVVHTPSFLRVVVDYGEKMHRSRILGEWSNMIGYKMGSSLARVYTTAKTCLMESFKHVWKMTWLPT